MCLFILKNYSSLSTTVIIIMFYIPCTFLDFYFVLQVVFSIFVPFSSSMERKALPRVRAASLSNGLDLHVYNKSDGFLQVPT